MSPMVTPTACNVSYAQFLTKSYARQIGIVLEVDWDAISSQCITFFSWRLCRNIHIFHVLAFTELLFVLA